MSTATTAGKAGKAKVFDGLQDILANGFDQVLMTDDQMIRIDIDEIEIGAQVREEFEDDEHTLDDLGDSLAVRQLQNIVVRPNEAGSAKPYKLVIGERRVRSAKLKKQRDLWALVARMSDEEAEAAQLAENIQRKNLTQLEEAKRIQRDLKMLGSADAVLRKYNKSAAWLSKRTALLHLPQQATRLIKENISADIEVVNAVRTIEKKDAAKAKEVVEELKAKRGKVNARDVVQAAKETVKPSKQKAKQPDADHGLMATARDRSQEEPGSARVFAGAKNARPPTRPAHEEPLTRAYIALFETGRAPKSVLESLTDEDRQAIEDYLATLYEAGKQATDPARIVVEGFRRGDFATDGVGAFALVTFLHGVDRGSKFNLLNIFGALKP